VGLLKYVTKYVRENYEVVKIKKEVAEKLRDFARKMGLTINDALAYLLTNMGAYLLTNIQDKTNIVDQIASEVADRVLAGHDWEGAKLLQYPGGDYRIFDQLNRLFMAAKASTFVEVFGGSCWCALNVSRSKFKVIVCNDIDEDLINLYKLIKEKPNDVIKRLAILPFSRELYDIAVKVMQDKSADPITKAVLFFYIIRASFSAKFGKGFSVSKVQNHAERYTSAIASIVEYAKRFKDVVLECKDFREAIRLYDSESTLFYLDPPYVGKNREDYYRHSFTIADLRSMAKLLKTVKGYWVLKIAEDNYELIKDALPAHEVEEVKTFLSMKKVMGEERPEFKYLIAHNIKIPKASLLLR